jgi:hypothetical protein
VVDSELERKKFLLGKKRLERFKVFYILSLCLSIAVAACEGGLLAGPAARGEYNNPKIMTRMTLSVMKKLCQSPG